MKKNLKLSGLMMFIALSFVSTILNAQSITIDGDFTDWTSVPLLHTNAVGTGEPLTAIKVIAGTTDIFFYVEGTEALTFSAFDMYIDTDNNPATGFLSGGYASGSGAELLIQGDVSPSAGNVNVYTGSGPDWAWGTSYGYTNADINFSALVPLTGKKAIEFSVKKSLLGTISTSIGFALIGRIGWDAAGSIPAVDLGSSYLPISTVEAPLPVTLVSFKGSSNTEGIQLNWSTLSENNNSYFEIFRSVDGALFEKITTTAGSINSSSLKSYRYTDKNPTPGTNYYQLRQIDLDGKTTVFDNIINIKSDFKSTSFNISGLAGEDAIQVRIYSENKTNSEFYLTDLTGKKLINKSLSLTPGYQSFTFPVKIKTGVSVGTLVMPLKTISQKVLLD